jgi:hypothetical protein
MKPLTTAQNLYLALGADPVWLLTVTHRVRGSSYTKKGPGRYHRQGKPKNK